MPFPSYIEPLPSWQRLHKATQIKSSTYPRFPDSIAMPTDFNSSINRLQNRSIKMHAKRIILTSNPGSWTVVARPFVKINKTQRFAGSPQQMRTTLEEAATSECWSSTSCCLSHTHSRFLAPNSCHPLYVIWTWVAHSLVAVNKSRRLTRAGTWCGTPGSYELEFTLRFP